MRFLATIASLVSLAAAAPQAEIPLHVTLETAGNSAVKATIANNGETNIRVFRTGSILDQAAIQKAYVTGEDGTKVRFHGIRQRISTQNIHDDSFEDIPAGKSVDVVFDVAQVHDLSSGGTFDIQSRGVMHYATQDNNHLAGSVPYESNTLRVTVDGPKAASVLKSFRATKRSTVAGDCTGANLSAAQNDLASCGRVARVALAAAQTNDQKMQEYFKDTSAATKNHVASVFNLVVNECNNRGVNSFHCADIGHSCGGNVVAYTTIDSSYQVYCDLFFNLPALTNSCHAQDQATTVVHEMTHLLSVAETSDLAYGYSNIMKLDTASALNNAESYSLFTNALLAGC
ncbi:hypothetical protein E4U42_006202 [Claviceps africana]|uniref:Neutral protease 2 n=1 Tax=Claviceps africana TaxID=83212 RepID=A0A8K0J2N2_9HYPO|nr:hypothetical protein E4U42_006202 [Claviceps africana]